MSEVRVVGLAGAEKVLAGPAVEALMRSLRGRALRPGEGGYDEARRLYNGMIDRHPALLVRCAGVGDVLKSVRFAREHGILVSVRAGGHNVAGYALCDGGLTIDLSAMRSVVVDPATRRARAEPGATWLDFDTETQAFGLATTGGLVASTGIAGLTLGGGIGWLMRKHGLTCDNLLGVDVVTGGGEFVTATEHENPDLLWAVRGGGGNFGVVTRFEYRLHPVTDLTAGMLLYPFDQAAAVLRHYRDQFDAAPLELGLDAALAVSPEDGSKFAALILVYNGPPAAARRVLEPWRTFLPPMLDTIGPKRYAEVQTMFEASVPAHIPNYWKSSFMRQLDDAAIDTIVAEFADAPTRQSQVLFEGVGGVMSEVARDAMAFDHRDARFNLLVVAAWHDRAEDHRNIEWARRVWQAMQPFSSGGLYANYMEEGGEGAARIRQAFGPGKYERLVAIKRKYDPDNLFRMNQNIAPSG